MKTNYSKHFVFLFFFFVFGFSSIAQNNYWTKTDASKVSAELTQKSSIPSKYELFQLDIDSFKNELTKASKKGSQTNKSGVEMSFPSIDGKFERFRVFESPIMHPDLAAKHPMIKTYAAQGIDDPTATMRFSVTQFGLHTMTLSGKRAAVYMDTHTSNNKTYIVYQKKDLQTPTPFECKVEELNKPDIAYSSEKTTNADDSKLRTFRLAIATTGEYSQYHLSNQGIDASATDAVKKTAVLSAIVVTMTRVNAIFERDVALTMKLVANNTDIIFLDSTTDGFTNDDSDALIDESQTVIDGAISSSNYDIGHTFSTGGGGLASLNSPCTSGKARGITGASNPIGDTYDIDFVVHEMGHQYGANHTFNNSCSKNRNDATAVEPGSGSTIMAYAGICSPNVQSNSDDYFHLVSIRQMWANITNGNSTCGDETTTSNNAPTSDDLPNYTIPSSTPFVLDVNASDTDGDNLTYTWEQLDTEITTAPPTSTAIGGPVFRSVGPSSSSRRFFPNQSTVLAGNLSNDWEVLPSVSRTMQFGVTIRDNNLSVGQTISKESKVTVDGNSGPFAVTSQISTETWSAGTIQTITWDVANTDIAPVNATTVDILITDDGGETFTTIVSDVTN
ncbi:MAG: hypothetical protein GY787_03935, partial [Alteromonadales bacterium]|nr:hypothetical protein [Alteromonadales bacterium]